MQRYEHMHITKYQHMQGLMQMDCYCSYVCNHNIYNGTCTYVTCKGQQNGVESSPEAWKRISGPPGPVDSRLMKAPTLLASLHGTGTLLLMAVMDRHRAMPGVAVWTQKEGSSQYS